MGSGTFICDTEVELAAADAMRVVLESIPTNVPPEGDECGDSRVAATVHSYVVMVTARLALIRAQAQNLAAEMDVLAETFTSFDGDLAQAIDQMREG